jgi:hypothetical protein
MSSLPGFSLESFLLWNYDLTADDSGEANISRGLAEALGTAPQHRQNITQEQLKTLTAMFEHLREIIEARLLDFDEENQSWRDYGAGVCDYISDELHVSGTVYLQTLRES